VRLQARVDGAADSYGLVGGSGLVGGIGEYEGAGRMAFVRGPEGITVLLAERIG
jgi:hypothetical protein